MSSRKTLLVLVALALAALTAFVLWRTRSETAADSAELELSRTASKSTSTSTPEQLAPSSSANAGERRESRDDAPPKSTVAGQGAATFEWTGEFVLPNGSEVVPALADVDLTLDGGAKLSRQVSRSPSVHFDDLAAGRYTLHVRCEGFTHREQHILIAERPSKVTGDHAKVSRGLDDDVVLWPERTIAVVVTSSTGAPLESIATELGLEPKRIFVGAFAARAFLDAPPDGAWPPDGATPLAWFDRPLGYQHWQVSDGVIGSLTLQHDAPLWIGLSVFGKPVSSEFLPVDAREIVFRLDRSVFDQRFAKLSLRVVDSADSSPVADARATLLADDSAHRRDDHAKLAVREDGRLTIERIVPGRYELSVARGDALHQARLELAAGESRDLGDIAIGLGRAIEVRTVDADGVPCRANIRVASYRAGAASEELFPPLRLRQTDERGVLRLPLPEGAAIVCAEGFDPQTFKPTHAVSPIALVDANAPLGEPLVLVLRAANEIEIHCDVADVERLELYDANDLRVAAPKLDSERKATALLALGRLRVRLLGANGESLGESEIVVSVDSKLVEIH